jgi:hypothetical protein
LPRAGMATASIAERSEITCDPQRSIGCNRLPWQVMPPYLPFATSGGNGSVG